MGAEFVQFSELARKLSGKAPNSLDWKSEQGLARLRSRSQELFKQFPRNRYLIQANAVLKEVEELIDQKLLPGALLRALEADFLLELAPLQDQDQFDRQTLARQWSAFSNRMESSPADHTIVQPFLQQALQDLRSDSFAETPELGREARAIVENVIPFYFEMLNER